MPYVVASAMIETEALDTNYPAGDGKTGDSYNLGICKQNWGMVKTCHPAFNSTLSNALAMNTDLALDIQVYIECRNYYGDLWWAGHRNGSTGLTTPNTQDIANFKAGEDWTYQQLQNGHMCDDLRFWVALPAILIVTP
jgi:hypothetical protein